MSTPDFRLDGRTALVTGAASGIGRAVAVGLAEMGAYVACFDQPESAVAEVSEQISDLGRRAIAVGG